MLYTNNYIVPVTTIAISICIMIMMLLDYFDLFVNLLSCPFHPSSYENRNTIIVNNCVFTVGVGDRYICVYLYIYIGTICL